MWHSKKRDTLEASYGDSIRLLAQTQQGCLMSIQEGIYSEELENHKCPHSPLSAFISSVAGCMYSFLSALLLPFSDLREGSVDVVHE